MTTDADREAAAGDEPGKGLRARWQKLRPVVKIVVGVAGFIGFVSGIFGIWAVIADPVGIEGPGAFLDDLFNPAPEPSVERITAQVRYNQTDWVSRTTINGGVNPAFEVMINYDNTSGVPLSDVTINVDSLSPAIPLKGSVVKIDSDNLRGVQVGDEVLSDDGVNIGTAKHAVHFRISYVLPSANMRCGENTITFRAHVRTPDLFRNKPVDSPEAKVTYNNECPGFDDPVVTATLKERPPEPGQTFVPSVVPVPAKP